MDKKNQAESQRTATADQSSYTLNTTKMSNPRTGRRGLARIVAATFLTAFITYYACFQWFGIIRAAPSYAGNSETVLGNKVPLEAHIISKCPDTRDALRELILPVMQRVSDKVDFKISYIGKPASHDGVECMHGPSECMGNIIELCARELYPDPKLSLGFIMCLTKDYKHIPERALVEDCALEHALDFDALNECATRDDGAHGLEMLRNSVTRTADVRFQNATAYAQLANN
ncbi:uncharacterized protein J7T54_007056 [Emericellopsis cladophorae]|uniref:Gamma interferon inducible lysosomal thiol reductase n=1 Tax=Emericellopsis cladophorae TaxID=2686198 RepID=A0A9P9Y9P4_9HYPO|nr:uncharacterized protein J7T54_007056 [Emericellopsis cladophorae]KAI6785414.1 hypothetical protein J7T54_007056 [Emericellopsis cladophorae]